MIFDDRRFEDKNMPKKCWGRMCDHGASDRCWPKTRCQFYQQIIQAYRWADFVSVTLYEGELYAHHMAVNMKRCSSDTRPKGIIIIAEEAARARGSHGKYTEKCVLFAREKRPISIVGFLALGKLTEDGDRNDFLTFATDIHEYKRSCDRIWKYQTPEEAISRGADVIFVWRPLKKALFATQSSLNDLFAGLPKVSETALRYQNAGWDAHEKLVMESTFPFRMQYSDIEEGNSISELKDSIYESEKSLLRVSRSVQINCSKHEAELSSLRELEEMWDEMESIL
jgi:hypothetical protein